MPTPYRFLIETLDYARFKASLPEEWTGDGPMVWSFLEELRLRVPQHIGLLGEKSKIEGETQGNWFRLFLEGHGTLGTILVPFCIEQVDSPLTYIWYGDGFQSLGSYYPGTKEWDPADMFTKAVQHIETVLQSQSQHS